MNDLGFIFYRSNYSETTEGSASLSVENLALLLDIYSGDERRSELNVDAYNISKDAMFNLGIDMSNRENMYNFCTVGNNSSPCSIISIYTASYARYHYGVSEDYYQVPQGHCNDTVSISLEAQERMTVPPVPLTENYLECRRTLLDTIIASAGIAVGNVLSVKSAMVIFFTALLARYTATDSAKKRDNNGRYVTYGTIERDKVLQYFAFNLLLARDGKYHCDSTFADSNLIAELAKELASERNLKRFFNPASDKMSPRGNLGNPIHIASVDGIELQERFKSNRESQDSVLTGSPKKNGKCFSSASFAQRNEKAFTDELLHNPMYLSEEEKRGTNS